MGFCNQQREFQVIVPKKGKTETPGRELKPRRIQDLAIRSFYPNQFPGLLGLA
jgi:hypothetical protein